MGEGGREGGEGACLNPDEAAATRASKNATAAVYLTHLVPSISRLQLWLMDESL